MSGAALPPRALLVQVALRGGAFDADAQEELQQLVESAGMAPAEFVQARRDRPDPASFLGSGKVKELHARAQELGASVLVIDVQLSPVQQRNLERELALPVLDRTALILDIFSRRAQSREGKLQVELARLNYLSTRLVRGWTHLERQRGGIGLRGGPGEKQIELDRRMIGVRVKQLREKLRLLDRQRGTQRRARMRGGVYRVSLVGYTNAGKSTLFNALAHADAYCADQLFATLDTTSRRCFAAPGVAFVLSDTVGFVRALPHTLVEAFRSTLDEAVHADLLLQVIDAASPARADQAQEVERVLEEIGAEQVPRLQIYNKVDRLARAPGVERDACGSIDGVWLSANTGDGIDLLRKVIADRIAERMRDHAGEAMDAEQDPDLAPAMAPAMNPAHGSAPSIDTQKDLHRSQLERSNIIDAF
ncbi:putative GTPase [Burkholderiales bacterium]|nr:putative GTPase [Burkholderiales bacterium]